jgi:hypothetical protein
MSIYLQHWNYFLALESDLGKLARFVEPTEDNFRTFSLEIVRIFLAACYEIDVVAKQYCQLLEPDKKAENVMDYRDIITKHQPAISETKVQLPRFGIERKPWKEWSSDKQPRWWGDHNKVKHERADHFDKANLENVVDACGGLLIILLNYIQHGWPKARLEPIPTLFTFSRELAKVDLYLGGGIAVHFEEGS